MIDPSCFRGRPRTLLAVLLDRLADPPLPLDAEVWPFERHVHSLVAMRTEKANLLRPFYVLDRGDDSGSSHQRNIQQSPDRLPVSSQNSGARHDADTAVSPLLRSSLINPLHDDSVGVHLGVRQNDLDPARRSGFDCGQVRAVSERAAVLRHLEVASSNCWACLEIAGVVVLLDRNAKDEVLVLDRGVVWRRYGDTTIRLQSSLCPPIANLTSASGRRLTRMELCPSLHRFSDDVGSGLAP